jgi:hypothetical protein
MELAMRLRGEARNLVLPNCAAKVPSYDKLCRALRERFGAIDAPAWYVTQLRNRSRKEKESVPELLQWIMNTGSKAYPEVPVKARDRFLTDFFVLALTDEEQSRYVLEDEPITVAEAAKSALRYEGIHKAVAQKRKETADDAKGRGRYVRAIVLADDEVAEPEPATNTASKRKQNKQPTVAPIVANSDAFTKQLTDSMNALTEKFEQMSATFAKSVQGVTQRLEKVEQRPVGRPSSPLGRQGSGVCFNCGRRGHFARDCRDNKCFNCGQAGHIARQCCMGARIDEGKAENGTGRGSGGRVGGPQT